MTRAVVRRLLRARAEALAAQAARRNEVIRRQLVEMRATCPA